MKTTIRPIAALGLSLVLLLTAGCSWGFERWNLETTEMHRQLSRTVDIQTGVILGDLDRANQAASRLAIYEGPRGIPSGAAAYLQEMQGQAVLISRTTDMDSVAESTGRMAAACGSCHLAAGGGPRFVVAGGPQGSNPEAENMIRFLWAADRMWEGLVGPSNDSWQAGLAVLVEDPISMGTGLHASTHGSISGPYAEAVRHLAARGMEARTQEERAVIYGELLGTCNDCHSAAGHLVER